MLRPLVGAARPFRLGSIRYELKGLANHAQGGEDAGALRWRARIDHRTELGPGEALIDLGGVLKPLCDVGGVGLNDSRRANTLRGASMKKRLSRRSSGNIAFAKASAS